jgi:hypothetical protein
MFQRDNNTTKEWKTINDKETPALGAKLQLAAKQ